MTAAQLRVVGAYRDQPKADEQIHRGRLTLQGKSGAAPASRARFMFTSRSLGDKINNSLCSCLFNVRADSVCFANILG